MHITPAVEALCKNKRFTEAIVAFVNANTYTSFAQLNTLFGQYLDVDGDDYLYHSVAPNVVLWKGSPEYIALLSETFAAYPKLRFKACNLLIYEIDGLPLHGVPRIEATIPQEGFEQEHWLSVIIYADYGKAPHTRRQSVSSLSWIYRCLDKLREALFNRSR
jgi:hypothetical protein